jgi:IS6 family transposase
VRSAFHATLEFGVHGPRLSGRHYCPRRPLVRTLPPQLRRSHEWLAERGVLVDQSTIYRWVQRFLPLFGEVARKYRAPIGPDWRVDETYARIRGRWHYIYRAIDGLGQIVDAYVSPTRDAVAARGFFERAIASSGTTPRRVITDKAATYPLALAVAVPGVLHRSGRYRTNGLEHDHGFLKERLRPMRGLKSVASAAIFMCGHALMRNIRHRFYWIVESVPQRLVLTWTWNRLAEAV